MDGHLSIVTFVGEILARLVDLFVVRVDSDDAESGSASQLSGQPAIATAQ